MSANTFCLLPEDILFEVLSKLQIAELGQLSLTCKKLNTLCDGNRIWSNLYFHKYGSLPMKIKEWKPAYVTKASLHSKINQYTLLINSA